MNVEVGTITGWGIKPNQGGADVVMLQVRVSSDDDVRSVELVSQPGDSSRPVTGSRVFVIELAAAWSIAIAVDNATSPQIMEGERLIYSLDANGVLASILLGVNGNVVINGGGDFGVRFSALEAAFNQLKTDFDSHAGHFTAETPPTPSTADISSAKVESVEMPL